MKLAIINQESSTGAWAYLYYLVSSMKALDTDLGVTIFVNTDQANDNVSKYIEDLTNSGVEIKQCRLKCMYEFQEKAKVKNKLFNKLINIYRKRRFQKKRNLDASLLALLGTYDVIFYSWPYGIEPLKTNVKTFFIPHDFIYSHCFNSTGGYVKTVAETIKKDHGIFLEQATPIVSTKFIADELRKTFPDYKKEVRVVPLSTFSDIEVQSSQEVQKVLKKYGIEGDYILSANNSCIHKNIGQVVSAMYIVKQKHKNCRLVLTGIGTEDFSADINSPYYSDWLNFSQKPDVLGLGLINSADFAAILQGAKMVVTTSFCEAGSGSGLDAWRMGTPMVMSDIEPFREQIGFLGTKAELCNPRNNEDVARAISYLLDNPDIAQKNAQISKEAMGRYTWKEVAGKYLKIFKGEIK